METSFGLLFYLKKFRIFKEDEVYIYMRITIDGHSAEISTKRKCKPENWNVAAGRLKGKTDFAKASASRVYWSTARRIKTIS